MAEAEKFQGDEHARLSQTRWQTPGLEWQAWRLARPLMGGLVGFAIVVAFLAIRGGESTELPDAIAGTQRGGWNRLEDVHLLIVVNGALLVGIAVGFLAEWVHHWLWVAPIVAVGGTLLAIREATSMSDGAEGALLGLVIACAVMVAAVAAHDLYHTRHRHGY